MTVYSHDLSKGGFCSSIHFQADTYQGTPRFSWISIQGLLPVEEQGDKEPELLGKPEDVSGKAGQCYNLGRFKGPPSGKGWLKVGSN